ncbi:MAG: transporter substrate-binding domain-containing protein [Clostridia bacterium]|nr:transporter substrate-binding domain-containing protein [Clostridia bacterium]
MKMKQLIAGVLATVATVATFGLASCSNEDKEIKVMKEILLTEEDYAFAIAKENTALLEEVNGLLATWTEDGSLDKLINSYFDGSAKFSYENKSSSPAANDFVMATNAYFPPFESKKGSAFVGVDVEIAYKLATAMNKTLFVYDMEFDSIISSVQTGESDIGMAGMTVTDTRLEQVNFATPYYSSAQVISVLASDTTFDACKTAADVEAILKSKGSSYKIGTQNGTTGFMYSKGDADFGYDGFTNLETKGYTTGALAMKDLQNGKINAVILDLQPSLMISKSLNG